MKPRIRIEAVLTAVIIALAPVALAQRPSTPSPIASVSPVQAKLTIPDTKLLPGVPFDMWIDVENPSDTTVGVGLCADMMVKPERRDPFTIAFGGENAPPYPTLLHEPSGSGVVYYLVLHPHQKQTLTIPIEADLQGPAYFFDPRLSPPGRYSIALRLDYCWPGMVTPQKSLLPPEFLGSVTTNEVTVERLEPVGSDAAVWKRMQEASNGKWTAARWDRAVMTEIITKYTDSAYYPYALAAATSNGADEPYIARLVDAQKRFPTSPVIEMLDISLWKTATHARPGDSIKYYEKLKQAKRPTTRILVFGREDAPPQPCPPDTTCED